MPPVRIFEAQSGRGSSRPTRGHGGLTCAANQNGFGIQTVADTIRSEADLGLSAFDASRLNLMARPMSVATNPDGSCTFLRLVFDGTPLTPPSLRHHSGPSAYHRPDSWYVRNMQLTILWITTHLSCQFRAPSFYSQKNSAACRTFFKRYRFWSRSWASKNSTRRRYRPKEQPQSCCLRLGERLGEPRRDSTIFETVPRQKRRTVTRSSRVERGRARPFQRLRRRRHQRNLLLRLNQARKIEAARDRSG